MGQQWEAVVVSSGRSIRVEVWGEQMVVVGSKGSIHGPYPLDDPRITRIRALPHRCRCSECEHVWEAAEYPSPCPKCGQGWL